MKTLDQIKNRGAQALDGRDFSRLVQFIPEDQLDDFGFKLRPEFIGKHESAPFTREAVLAQLKDDVAFGFKKALDQRGLSASMMAEVVMMWNWVLEDGLEDFDDYAQYGLPIFKATAMKYGFQNLIGDDTGSESEYASD